MNINISTQVIVFVPFRPTRWSRPRSNAKIVFVPWFLPRLPPASFSHPRRNAKIVFVQFGLKRAGVRRDGLVWWSIVYLLLYRYSASKPATTVARATGATCVSQGCVCMSVYFTHVRRSFRDGRDAFGCKEVKWRRGVHYTARLRVVGEMKRRWAFLPGAPFVSSLFRFIPVLRELWTCEDGEVSRDGSPLTEWVVAPDDPRSPQLRWV